MILKPLFFVDLCLGVCLLALSDARVEGQDAKSRIAPLTDGMTIATSDSIATVDVRAMSMGPGACGVKISTINTNVEFLAPPLVWSDWTILASHYGKAHFTISFDPVCDTGAIGEVRYFPE